MHIPSLSDPAVQAIVDAPHGALVIWSDLKSMSMASRLAGVLGRDDLLIWPAAFITPGSLRGRAGAVALPPGVAETLTPEQMAEIEAFQAALEAEEAAFRRARAN